MKLRDCVISRARLISSFFQANMTMGVTKGVVKGLRIFTSRGEIYNVSSLNSIRASNYFVTKLLRVVFGNVTIRASGRGYLVFAKNGASPPSRYRFAMELPSSYHMSLRKDPYAPIVSRNFTPFIRSGVLLVVGVLKVLGI